MKPRVLMMAIAIGGTLLARPVAGVATASGLPIRYQLIEGSMLCDCYNTDPPSRLMPLRGSFELVQTNRNPLFSYFAVQNVDWHAGTGTNDNYRLTGQGRYQFGGEAGFFQSLTLQLQVDTGSTNQSLAFTNPVAGASRRWPSLDIGLIQSGVDPTQTTSVVHYFEVHLSAAPFRELWFSTVAGLTSGNRSGPTNVISPGDLLANSGRVVRTQGQLVGSLGLTTGGPGLGVDAVDIGPGGEIFFSLNQDTVSGTLGSLQQGDLLSDRGRIVQRNAQLLAAFLLPDGTPDAGLDALHTLDSGEILFSITTNVFSQSLNTTLGRGDVLSNHGLIFKSNQQLLAAFHPADPSLDYGLHALYVWPNGELWFSTEDGFMDTQLGPISSGDLLSDGGFIVYRNLELVSAFVPLEDLSNFGLGALFVVTDVTTPPPSPQILLPVLAPSGGGFKLTWIAKGKVFQVEKAEAPAGPFASASPLVPGLGWSDPLAFPVPPNGLYRLRAW